MFAGEINIKSLELFNSLRHVMLLLQCYDCFSFYLQRRKQIKAEEREDNKENVVDVPFVEKARNNDNVF